MPSLCDALAVVGYQVLAVQSREEAMVVKRGVSAMTGVEAVARAICKSQCTCSADDKCDDYDGWPTRAARAALAAIRTPTPGMVEAMFRLAQDAPGDDGATLAECFTAAIDAAMEDASSPAA